MRPRAKARIFRAAGIVRRVTSQLREPTPALFSFNNPVGACPVCRGFGRVIGIDLDRAMPDTSLEHRGGCGAGVSGRV